MNAAPVSEPSGEEDSVVSAAVRLRRSRLIAASVFLTALASVGLAWSFLVGDGLWPVHLTAGLCLGAAYTLLSTRKKIAPGLLKIVEFAIFGFMAADLIAVQYHQMLAAAADDDLRRILTERRNALVAWMHLMFAYAIFIPNSWRSAAPVILLFALAPIATEVLAAHQHPAACQLVTGDGAQVVLDGANLTLMLTGAALAIYGTHVLHTLRHEVFEARRLNQYQLGEPLGAGSMGEVYLAEHRLLKRPCAVKLIRPDKDRDPKALSRFEQEVREAARLSHPNIVEVYDYGQTDDGTFYYVMEYLQGQSLEELVKQVGPLPAERVIHLLSQVCDGVAEAHAAGLIHRDLKPANIFVANIGQRNDVAKVLDFWLAWRRHSSATQSTPPAEVAGTPAYMAPEQVQADPALDHRADLYALGSVGYFLLTGVPPFTATTPLDVMMAHVNSQVLPPSRVVPSIDDDLEQIVLRCLKKNPSDRFGTATELKAALMKCQRAGDWASVEASDA